MFYHDLVVDQCGRIAFVLRTAGREKSAPWPGEAAATGPEGGPKTRVHSSAGQSALLDKELKVRGRGGSDRGQRLSRFGSPAQLLLHTIPTLGLLLQTQTR